MVLKIKSQLLYTNSTFSIIPYVCFCVFYTKELSLQNKPCIPFRRSAILMKRFCFLGLYTNSTFSIIPYVCFCVFYTKELSLQNKPCIPFRRSAILMKRFCFLGLTFPWNKKPLFSYLKRGCSSERGIRTLDTTGMNRML